MEMGMNTTSSVTVDPEAPPDVGTKTISSVTVGLDPIAPPQPLDIAMQALALEEPSQSESPQPLLLKLPKLAINKVLGYLEPHHLFSLRLTSKAVNLLATEYMRGSTKAKGPTNFYLEIFQCTGLFYKKKVGSTTFREILDNGYVFPIRSLYLNNANEDIFEDPCITEFLQLYGSDIKKLKIKNFCLSSSAQRQFFMELKNLVELKILIIEVPEPANPEYLLELSIPDTFKKIEVLKLGKIEYPTYICTYKRFHKLFLEKFPNLKVLRIPKVCYKAHYSIPEGTHTNDWEFKFLLNYIKNQIQNHSTPPNLVKLDFKNDIEKVTHSSELFLKFVNQLFHHVPHSRGIQFHNVNERFLDWFDYLTILGEPDGEEDRLNFKAALDNHICSMKNISQSAMDLDLGNLTKLDINVSECLQQLDRIIQTVGCWERMRVNLNELVKLRIYYDKLDWSEVNMPNMDLNGLRDHMEVFFWLKNKYLASEYQEMKANLFGSQRYESLKELCIEFGEAFGNLQLASSRFDGFCLTNHFYMVKKLELINWNPCVGMFVCLWEEFGDNNALEELVLKDCASLGNAGFIGPDQKNPAFLKLKDLRKLTLKVDKMDKLSDRTFEHVFRHMSLMEFMLISEKPMDKITRTGIEWLLEGCFAKSILKFPFTTWTATTIQPEEMLPLKAQFKSLIY